MLTYVFKNIYKCFILISFLLPPPYFGYFSQFLNPNIMIQDIFISIRNSYKKYKSRKNLKIATESAIGTKLKFDESDKKIMTQIEKDTFIKNALNPILSNNNLSDKIQSNPRPNLLPSTSYKKATNHLIKNINLNKSKSDKSLSRSVIFFIDDMYRIDEEIEEDEIKLGNDSYELI